MDESPETPRGKRGDRYGVSADIHRDHTDKERNPRTNKDGKVAFPRLRIAISGRLFLIMTASGAATALIASASLYALITVFDGREFSNMDIIMFIFAAIFAAFSFYYVLRQIKDKGFSISETSVANIWVHPHTITEIYGGKYTIRHMVSILILCMLAMLLIFAKFIPKISNIFLNENDGIAVILIAMALIGLDFAITLYRVFSGSFGFNKFEAAELAAFIAAKGGHPGGPDGPIGRSVAVTRTVEEPSFGGVVPEASKIARPA